ncbi:MAG: cellulose synthase regulator protein [Gammaproteobacteria bacterium]|jgi:hypothetical protein|nr:cellulose synthase regulator protein [Gammaproteobacteria bacterium]
MWAQRINCNKIIGIFLCFLLSVSGLHAENNKTDSPLSSQPSNLQIKSKKNNITPVSDTTNKVETLGEEKQRTYTLLQMSGTDGFILKGASAVKIFYLPILHEWDLDRVSLHFTIYRAALSNKNTTLTLLVNDNPVSSLELSGRINDKTPWDVTIPLSLLKGNTVNIRINSASSGYGYDCYNLTNPNYWVYITGDSTVTYHYKPIAYVPNLSKFPYPFIKDPSLEKDTIAIALPAHVSLDNLSSVFYLANALGRRETWRGIKLIGTTVDHLTDETKRDANIIYVGTAKELQIDKMNIQWPLMINENEEILDKENKVINDQTGVILLAVSPWNPTHAVLVVTGNSDTAVRNAALMLRDPNFSSSVLFPGYAFVPQAPEIKITQLDWTNITFKNLGYDNRAVYGNGENTLNYSINLPDNKITQRLALSIDYSVSPFLSAKESSTLTLKINDLPVGGTILDTNNTSISHWKYLIQGNNLRPGANIISLTFNLKLKNIKCTPEDASSSWAMIYSSTELRAIFKKERPLLDLIKFPSMLDNALIVTIPQSEEYFTSDNFLQAILELSEKMSKVSQVKFMNASSITPEDAANSNILFLGNPEENNIFGKYKSAFPFYFINKKIVISPRILPYLAISDETPVTITQLIPSPFNADKTILMVSSLNEDGFKLGLDLLNDSKKTNLVNGNVALIYQNGTFTSIQSQRLAEHAKNKQTVRNIGKGVYIAGICIILLVIIVLVTRYIRRKIKDYFGKR